MVPELREALSGLCRGYGWSYGIVWRVDRREPRLLTVEDNYCEEEHRVFVEHLLDQINIVGKGILGETALGDKHKWIYHDAYHTYSCIEMDTDNPEETTVIVSQPSFGVAQFGSTKKVPESLDFVDQAKCLLQLIGHKGVNFTDHHAAVTSTSSSGNAYFLYENNPSNEGRMINTETLRGIDYETNIFSQLSSVDLLCPDRTMSPFSLPVTSSSIDTSRSVNQQHEKTVFKSRGSTLHFTNQSNATGVDSGGLCLPLNRIITNSGCRGSSVVGNHNTNNWSNNVNIPTVEQEMLSVLGLEGLPNLVPMNSNFSVPQPNALNQFSVGTQISSQCGLQDTVPEARTLMTSKGCLPSGVTSPLQNSSSGNTDYVVPSIAVGVKSSLTCPQIISPRSSMLASKVNQTENLIHLSCKNPEQVNGSQNVQMNECLASITYLVKSDASVCNMTADLSASQVDSTSTRLVSPLNQGSNWKENASVSNQLLPSSDFFDGMELEHGSSNFVQEYWDDILMPGSGSNLCINLSEGISELNMSSVSAVEKSQFMGSDLEQLLDAIVGENVNQSSSRDSINKTSRPFSGLKLDHQLYAIPSRTGPSMYNKHVSSACMPSTSHKSNSLLPHCNPEGIHASPKSLIKSSGGNSWIDDSFSMNTENSIHNQQKGEENVKVIKKRARPGESTRPRPKDRQQIQDRVKELREIVPNGAKCSIDALLDRTIKHMLFMQSVTKYADKLKQSDEPKMIVEESGVVLKENFGSGNSGGATWAYEVAGQTMVCPIIVEDLTPTGQMLVEMLCEDHGFFLEIADIIRGFGLTILKGVMEIRECKIWARFIVEANRDVTRMDIFLSLVQLLQQTSSFSDHTSKLVENGTSMFNYQQSPISIPINTKAAVI